MCLVHRVVQEKKAGEFVVSVIETGLNLNPHSMA